jgi:hypothetical protein
MLFCNSDEFLFGLESFSKSIRVLVEASLKVGYQPPENSIGIFILILVFRFTFLFAIFFSS